MTRGYGWAVAGASALVVMGTADWADAAPRTHDGFYMSLQPGLGYLSTSAEAQGFEESYSGVTSSAGLLLGGTVGPVVIGGGFTYDNAFSPSYDGSFGSGDLDNVELFLIGLGAFVDIYPDPTEGLHFLGFVGWGGLEASVDGNVGGSDPTGMLLTVGAGYDFWLSDEWSVGPLGRLTYAPLSLNDVDYSTTQITIAADFKLH